MVHFNGLAGIRTQGLCLAKAALYQLSYKPQVLPSDDYDWVIIQLGFNLAFI
jgi:hypothetical protein